MKRHRSPDSAEERSDRAKASKTLSNSSAGELEARQSLGNDGRARRRIGISVTLRSASKAARNDPKSASPEETIESLGDLDEAQAFSAAAPPELADGQDPSQRNDPETTLQRAGERQVRAEREPEYEFYNANDHGVDGDHNKDGHVDDDEYDDEDDDDALSYDDGIQWLEEIDGNATLDPTEDQAAASKKTIHHIAECNAKLIRRSQMRESFWLEMESPLQETHDLAFDLFDRYGRLDREFYKHDFRKGTGVWGNELDHGDLLLFETLKVHADYRRCGIGTKIVNAILAKTRKKVSESVGFFAVVRPGFLYSEVPREGAAEAKKEMCGISLGFWHSLGFRRVGISSWLARTDSPDHPSRHLEIDQDWKQPDEIGKSSSPESFERLADPAVEETECIEELTNTLPEDSEDQQWLSCDQDGNTILHVAAMSFKPELIKFVFSRAARLAAARNKDGYTALEALRNRLEHQRTRKSNGHRTDVASDAFKGYSTSNIACIAALEETAAFDLETLTPADIEVAASVTDEQIRYAPQFDIAGIRTTLQYKYGCTCGQCVGGFLSSRMKFALLCVAEVQHDIMHDSMDDSGPGWVENHNDLLAHLPGYVRQNLKTNKSMRQGFANMCDHFAECLRRGIIPTERGVLDVFDRYRSEWPPVTKNFLQRGGTVAAVANMIFEMAMDRDELAGDGEDREVFGKEVDELVVCRNDHEFGFVGGACGYKRVRPASSRFVDMYGRELDLD